MKLIIDIPNSLYANLAKIRNGSIANRRILDSVKNGTPLDDVKAKIRAKHFHIVEKNDFDNGRTYAYEECISILDNIGKAESEK